MVCCLLLIFIFQLKFLDKGEECHVKHHSSSHIDFNSFNSVDPQNQQSPESEETDQELGDDLQGLVENELSLDGNEQGQVVNGEDGFLEKDLPNNFVPPDDKMEPESRNKNLFRGDPNDTSVWHSFHKHVSD